MLQIHLWGGLTLGLYAFVIGVTGSILVFEPELQALSYPHFYRLSSPDQPLADPTLVLRNVEQAYPGYRVTSVNWPTPDRNSFVSYPSRDGDTRTVFAHPVSGSVLGELPKTGVMQFVWQLHVYLLAGRTGLRASGIAAGCLVLVSLTGLVLWWPGLVRWSTAFAVGIRRAWWRMTLDLHKAVGFWTTALLLMWAISGVYLTAPEAFRSVVNVISPLSVRAPAPSSDIAPKAGSAPPLPKELVARALETVPGARPVRYTVPSGDRAAAVVVVARGRAGNPAIRDEVTVYLDRHTGRVLESRSLLGRSTGDMLMAWLFPLHAGRFAGTGVKILWAVLALSFPALFLSGIVIWWNRVPGNRRAQAKRAAGVRRIA